MGKENFLTSGIISYSRHRRPTFVAYSLCCIAVAVGIIGCAANRPGRFSGVLQPAAGTCDPAGSAFLTLDDTRIHFTPREGVITLDGTLVADGTIHADAISNGMDHAPYHQSFIGRLVGDQINGTYTTPRCNYTVTLSGTSR
jgi:hypothetical protein